MSVKTNEEEKNEVIPHDISLTHINLPNKWVFYLYEKQLFKKMANRPNFQAKPHKQICTISTVNDLLYILQLMEVKLDNKLKVESTTCQDKINLDSNDYIIMRKGIEPIWEDPRNSNGGTFTIRMDHSKGYDVWSTFMMYMLGETMTNEMHNINGMTVSYISDMNGANLPNTNKIYNLAADASKSFTYIKIWDGKSDRTEEQFINILPPNLMDKIRNESLRYSPNNKKEDFNKKNIVNKLNYSNRGGSRNDYGGFTDHNSRGFTDHNSRGFTNRRFSR